MKWTGALGWLPPPITHRFAQGRLAVPLTSEGDSFPSGGACDQPESGGSAGRWRLVQRLLLALLLTVAASGAGAQTARLAVLADSVSAGLPFEVSVAVTHAPGRQVEFPAVQGDPDAGPLLMVGDVEALSVRRLPPSIRGAVRVDSAVYRVVTFTADSARVGPLAVAVDTVRVRTGSALVPVRSVLSGPPPHEPAGFGPPDAFASATPLWIGLGLLAAAVIAGAVWAATGLLRRPRPKTRMAPYPAAKARLQALSRRTPQTPAEVEAHVVAVRETVRGYLADRLAVPAREATTSEVLALLDGRVAPATADAVRQSLVPTDLVAFAGVRPSQEVVARLRGHAQTAVDAVEAEVTAREQAASQTPPS